MKRLINLILLLCAWATLYAQTGIPTATPSVTYFSKEKNEQVTVLGSETFTEEAPLSLHCSVEMSGHEEYTCIYDWQLRRIEQGRASLLIRRSGPTEAETTLDITESGTYNIKFAVACYYGGSLLYDINDLDSITFSVPESALTCPDGISPNGDDKNDYLILTCKSIVKLDALIFNRWGRKVATCDYAQAAAHEKSTSGRLCIWDGYIGSRPDKDGVYFLNLVAEGSDGVVYKIKKAINVLKGYTETDETEGDR